MKPAPANSLHNPILKTPTTKIGLVEWFKVKALSSRPNNTKKKKGKEKKNTHTHRVVSVWAN
jgi:hypothetical protein